MIRILPYLFLLLIPLVGFSQDSLLPPPTPPLPALPPPVLPPVVFPSILKDQMIVAYYGSPKSKKMGILGEQSLEETGRLLKIQAAEWDGINGDEKVLPALHLIYATIWPDGNLGILPDSTVQAYVDYAEKNAMIVVLDHQLGKYAPVEAVRSMLKWLKYPSVHLAVDPEWKTVNPGLEIGTVKASDINDIQKLMQDYLIQENINQKKILIVHQFHYKMISDRDQVRSDFERIDLIHHIDGFGAPSLKKTIYTAMSRTPNLPIKGFKLFLPKSWKIAGFDIPMLTPTQVLGLTPRPVYISYQ